MCEDFAVRILLLSTLFYTTGYIYDVKTIP